MIKVSHLRRPGPHSHLPWYRLEKQSLPRQIARERSQSLCSEIYSDSKSSRVWVSRTFHADEMSTATINSKSLCVGNNGSLHSQLSVRHRASLLGISSFPGLSTSFFSLRPRLSSDPVEGQPYVDKPRPLTHQLRAPLDTYMVFL